MTIRKKIHEFYFDLYKNGSCSNNLEFIKDIFGKAKDLKIPEDKADYAQTPLT